VFHSSKAPKESLWENPFGRMPMAKPVGYNAVLPPTPDGVELKIIVIKFNPFRVAG